MRTSAITLLYSFIYYQLLSPKIKSFPWIIYYLKFGLLGFVRCFSEMMKRDHRFRNVSFQVECILGEKKPTPKGEFLTSTIAMTILYCRQQSILVLRDSFVKFLLLKKIIPLQIKMIWKNSLVCLRTPFT